jgi:16S rRNA (cytosine1402-N4)-methyltransferase
MTDRNEVEQRGEGACHVPVMVGEVRRYLVRPSTRVIVDATVGLAGHAEALMEAAPARCVLIGTDLDEEALGLAGRRLSRFGERVILEKMNFADLARNLPARYREKVDALLVDCGISGLQIVSPHRGFSFDREGALDMRFDPEAGIPALSVIQAMDRKGFTRLLKEFGEDRFARKIAASVIGLRDSGGLRSTSDLARAVKSVVRQRPAKSLARVFLSLRATVNSEIENLCRLLDSLPDLLARGGRVCVISYHSLEDRAVKTAFRRLSGRCVCPPGTIECGCGKASVLRVLTPKPVKPQLEEIERNISARSAKLRAAERI